MSVLKDIWTKKIRSDFNIKDSYAHPVGDYHFTMDGVGSKISYADDKLSTAVYYTAGWDLVAVNVNDLICKCVVPEVFMDYIKVPYEYKDKELMFILKGMKEALDFCNMSLIGGELAFHGNEYDLCGVAGGRALNIKPDNPLDEYFIRGKKYSILGLHSEGLHSNGFTLASKYINPAPMAGVETMIYSNDIINMIKKGVLKPPFKLAHITGGGLLGNIERVADKSNINFHGILRLNDEPYRYLSSFFTFDDMLRSFNCGYGFVIICENDVAENIDNVYKNCDVIGEYIG